MGRGGMLMKTCQKCGTHTDGREFCSTCFEFARAVVRAMGNIRRLEHFDLLAAQNCEAEIKKVQERFELSIKNGEPPFVKDSNARPIMLRSRAATAVALQEIEFLAVVASNGGDSPSPRIVLLRQKVDSFLNAKEESGRRPRFSDVLSLIATERDALLKQISFKLRRKHPPTRMHVAQRCGGNGFFNKR